MPDELIIALVVIFIAGWVLFALLRGLSKVAGDAHETVSGLFAERRAQKFEKRKAQFARSVKFFVPNRLARAESELRRLESEFQRRRAAATWVAKQPTWVAKQPTWEKKPFPHQPFFPKRAFWHEMEISEIDSILCPDPVPWQEKESAILAQDCSYPADAPTCDCSEFYETPRPTLQLEEATFQVDEAAVRHKDVDRFFRQERTQVEEYNRQRLAVISQYDELSRQIEIWNREERERWKSYVQASTAMAQEELASFRLYAKKYSEECNEQKASTSAILRGYQLGERDHVIARIQRILGSLTMPSSVPRLWDVDFDHDQHILIAEIGLPDIVHRPPAKTVLLKSGPVRKPLNQTERKEFIPKVHPAILLRIAFELFRNDASETIKLLVLNGWVNFDDPATGINRNAYTASLMLERHQVASINLRKIDPVAAFQNLNGKSAGRLIEIVPIEPTLALTRTDSRFVVAKEVLDNLDGAANLAAMDWQNFEHLIRELFQKEFAGHGAEVKITQASRDRGVDAIAFDPDPIHGGKYVIQAKCYTNTVDVSAVRDLCAVVRKEGASRGILVTTSTYGADAYVFANNEPVTLLNGAELLGLLRKHGYSFRIDLQEARRWKAN
jgi:restriction system protein